jgi:hypothetical protein
MLDNTAKSESKYKISVFNSSVLISNFYFYEDIENPIPSNSLVQMHNAPYKWLRFRECRFNLTNQIAFLNDGVNTEVQTSLIDISRANSLMQISGTNKCPYYYTEGIGNNLILNKLTITGKNSVGLNRLFVIYKPMNVTVTNTKFIDTKWRPEAFGIVSGYPEDIALCKT